MPVKDWSDWSLSQRGMKDAQRHREKIDKSIRDNVQNVISSESIITQKSGRKIKIPVKGLKDYKFVYGNNTDTPTGGIGQGPAGPGDVIARRIKGSQNGKPGDQAGEDFLEVEVDIAYFLDIMFKDLGLPFIEEKTSQSQLVPVGFKFDSISKIGIQPRLHKNKTVKESIKRMIVFASEIVEETGCSEEDALRALLQTHCDISESIELIKSNKVDKNIIPNLLIDNNDLRFKQIDDDFEIKSNAVIICIMDNSGSMNTEKKYLVRSFLFWLVEFLKKTYDNVQIRFISHSTEAQFVEEPEFFAKGSDGGTIAHTAFDLASYTLMTEYPAEEFNRYVCYAGDGELFDPEETVNSIKALLKTGVNMLNYIQVENISEETSWQYDESLLELLTKKFKFIEVNTKKESLFYKNMKERFFMCQLKEKEDVWAALKFFLFEKTGG